MADTPSVSELLPTIKQLIEQMTAFAGLRASKFSTGDRNFLGKTIRMMAQIWDGGFRVLRQLDADWPPSPDTSTTTLRRQANIFGLSNNAGGFGFKVAQVAQGGQGIITGTGGTVVAAGPGATLTGPDGVTQYVLRSDVAGNPNVTLSGIAPGTGQGIGVFDATTPGAAGNLPALSNLRWNATPPNIDSTVVLTLGFGTTGKDEEAPADAQRRLGLKLQLPPKGGAPQDYAHGSEAWAENAEDAFGNLITGIRAYGFNGGASGDGSGYDGTGGAMAVITIGGTGLSRIPTAQILTDIDAWIKGSTSRQGKRPLSHSYRSIAPFMDPNITGLFISCRVVPSKPLYAFDWACGLTVYTVAAWDGVSKLTVAGPVVGTGTVPLDMKTSVDNHQKPRLFIDTRIAGAPVGPVIPPMARVLSYQDVAGQTVLTLDTPLPVTWQQPSVGDQIFSGQAVICDAAAGIPFAILSFVDSLGPSRVSGLYDPNDYWSDICSISGVEAAAKNVLTSDQITPYIERTLAGQTLIGVGATGTPIVQDVQAPDNSTFGPGMWLATRILVTD